MKKVLKRSVLALAATASLAAGGYWGYGYWTVGRFLQSTDDAYVKADYTTVAPKVSGYVAEVMVADNQKVAAGQVLARIDDRDFRTALARAQADVADAEAGIRSLDAQLALQQSVIAQGRADVAAADAALGFARADDARYRHLMETGYGTVQRAEQAAATLREDAARLARARAALDSAKKQLAVLKAQRAKAETQLAHNRAVEQQAELNLHYTVITAPIDGTVGARSLRVGQYVQAGTQLMAVVPLHAVYVVANFKETQLAFLRRGAPATVSIDTFAGHALNGRVDSVAPASGLEFALLPPDNATGNFTKIVQRIPVKIALDGDGPLAGLLRPGMSVEATVDTKAVALAAAKDGPAAMALAGR